MNKNDLSWIELSYHVSCGDDNNKVWSEEFNCSPPNVRENARKQSKHVNYVIVRDFDDKFDETNCSGVYWLK